MVKIIIERGFNLLKCQTLKMDNACFSFSITSNLHQAQLIIRYLNVCNFMGVTEGWMWLLLIGTRGGGGGGRGSRPSPQKIKQISFFVFRGKNWRDLGKNKSHDFYLYITYSSGWLYLLFQNEYHWRLQSLFFIVKDSWDIRYYISQIDVPQN